MATGMIGEIGLEIGYGVEVGVATFGSPGEPSRELVLLNFIDASPTVAMTRMQAIALAASIFDAASMLDAPPTRIIGEVPDMSTLTDDERSQLFRAGIDEIFNEELRARGLNVTPIRKEGE